MELEIWNKLKGVPDQYLRLIDKGRLKGKNDVNPQWRMERMTEVFGPCGDGWKYEIVSMREKDLADGQVMCFVEILLYYRIEGCWSDPIPGTGGSMLVKKEHSGLHASDEGYKMATTDALSVAMKAIGVAASVYLGQCDTKYAQTYSQPVTKEDLAESGTIRGVPVLVDTKDGKKRNGEDYHMEKYKIGEISCSTFEDNYQKALRSASDTKHNVSVKWVRNARGGINIVSVDL